MKAKSFKGLIMFYGVFVSFINTICILSTIFVGPLISSIFHKSEITGLLIAGIIMIMVHWLCVCIFNKRLYKVYRMKLCKDAITMTEEMKNNHLGDPTKLKEVLKELNEINILKK